MKRGRDVFVLVVCLFGLLLALVGEGQGQESCWNMGTCPSGYYNTNSTPVEPCNASSTTNVSTPTTEAASTTGDTTITTAPTPPSVSTTSTIHPTTSTAAAENVTVEVKVMCLKCDSACSTCNGSGPQNCIKCAQEYEKNNSAACAKKQEPKKDELNIVLIAGAAAGGFVVVVLVVVLLACCVCRRRRRRRRNREEDGEGLQSVRPDSTAEVPAIEDKDSAEPSGVSVKREGFEPTYQNVPKAPRPESIERGHDKVTRYTRDPTVKNLRPVIERSNTEEQELQQLPPAPVPPPGARKKSMEPPLEQYEIVEVGQENHQPRQRAATAYPKQHGHPHPGRGPRRQTDPGNGAFPYPSGGFSEPTLPSHTTTRSPRERPLSEAPEDDYENMLDETGKKNFHKPPAVPEPSNSDSDLDDYENTGPKGSLIPHDRKGRQQGHDNRGVDLDEEPQELYGNQDVINECKEDEGPLPDYVDMSGAPPPQRPVSEDDDQPVYGNEVEHPYQNVHFP